MGGPDDPFAEPLHVHPLLLVLSDHKFGVGVRLDEVRNDYTGSGCADRPMRYKGMGEVWYGGARYGTTNANYCPKRWVGWVPRGGTPASASATPTLVLEGSFGD